MVERTPGASNLPPTVASQDAAWVRVPTSLTPTELAGHIQDVEAMLRINPYLYFRSWKQTGPVSYHAELDNQSNKQTLTLDLELIADARSALTINYRQGLKSRTVFTIEPLAGGSYLVITDDYSQLPKPERERRAAEVDKSLLAWGEALRIYFKRLQRWSWLPGWRWYIRRVWVPMKPSARRIVWLLFLITIVEFFFFLFVLLIYVLEQNK